jgi:hypothetical protein
MMAGARRRKNPPIKPFGNHLLKLAQILAARLLFFAPC